MFELQAEVHPSYCPSTALYNWKSTTSGIEIVLVKCKTPAVNGYFAAATEIDNDSGCPHTLEHLVFMGSKKYPYKGFLDVLGNKLLSSTNAWTGKDQTVYTLSTAGWQGFAGMLPVYLDHVLHPKITESTCMTEVFHIDGEGQERGVVFSEMQGVENTPFSLISSELHRKMYGESHPYSANTGGLLDALRVIDHEQIGRYHTSSYSPHNLCVIVTGDVDPNEFVDVMTEFEQQLDPAPAMRRPFSDIDAAPALSQTQVLELEFPESDEQYGEVQMGWFGTEVSDVAGYEAVEVINYYFTSENNGKLQKAIVENDDPLCTSVSIETDDYKTTLITISVNCVPTERLCEVDEAVLKVLREAADPNTIDIDFMRDSVRRKYDKFILSVENDPASFAYMAIDNFLYGEPGAAMFKQWANEDSIFEELLGWDATKWASFIANYFINAHHTTILGKPSKKLEKDVKKAKKVRAEQIKAKYDLEELGRRVADAKKENEEPVPAELLDKFAAPDLNKINFIQSESAGASGNGDLQKLILNDTPKDFDLNIQFESFSSHFVTIKIYLSAEPLDKDLLPYIDVILCELFALPMKLDDGTELTAEQVGLEVSRDTLVSSISTNAMLQELVMLDLRIKKENYSKAIMWIERAIFNSVFDHDRLSMFIKKFLSSVSEEMREGNSVMVTSIHEHSLTESSLRRQSEMLLTAPFFKTVQDDGPRVEKDMKRLIQQLFVPNNFRILVFGDIYKLERPVSAWNELYTRLLNGIPASGKLLPVPFSHAHHSELGRNPSNECIITLCPTDSSYMSIVASAPTDYHHADIPALTLLNVLLGVTEGPLWREIRGEGLAYGARIFHRQELGYVICEFYSASDPIQAYKTTKKLVNELAAGEHMFTDRDIEGAVLGFASAVALDQATYSSAIIQKFFDTTLKDLGKDYVPNLIAQVSRVTKAQLLCVLKRYLLPLFSSDTSAVFNVCHSSESEAVASFFASIGYKVTTKRISTGGLGDYQEDSEGDFEDGSGSESETDSEDESNESS